MQHHILAPGTILDGRYRVEALLGQGGFGITYAAVNQRIDQKVAIKELFWRGHSARDVMASPEVVLSETKDAPAFDRQMDRFLQEARTIRDFSNEPGIVRILDYFEANHTAYIVMEYVEGETLEAYLKTHGKIETEDLLRRFLPLIRSLARIHAGNVIHRDISPENIMVQPDGSLKLIDFGAARDFLALTDGSSAAIAKECYAPSEQYDRNGRQGPWTDVYALCATLYRCIAGMPPESAMQRMFLDELKSPSQLGVEIQPKIEAILMRGLQLSAPKRWQSMEELEKAILEVLPEHEPARRRRGVWIIATAALLCVAAVLGILLIRQNGAGEKFRNVVTEVFYLDMPSGMSLQDFSEARHIVEQKMADLAGEDNYIVTATDARITAEVPLAAFDGREVREYLIELVDKELKPLSGDAGVKGGYQLQANWEDPSSSVIAGDHQVQESALGENAVFFAYQSSEALSRGERANMIVDMKARLDALDAPYAFGTVYGNEDMFVFCLNPERIGRFVTDTVGSTYPLKIAGECSYNGLTVRPKWNRLYLRENPDGTCSICYEVLSETDQKQLAELTEAMLKQDMHTLYLQSSGENIPIASMTFDEPLAGGVLEFTEFCFGDETKPVAECRYLADYILTLENDTALPTYCNITGEGIWDVEQNRDSMFEGEIDDSFGIPRSRKKRESEYIEALKKIRDEQGYQIGSFTNTLWINLNFALDEKLQENIETAVQLLLEKYSLGDYYTNSTTIIPFIEEQGQERFRLALNTSYDYEKNEYCRKADIVVVDQGRLAPYVEDFQAWWDAFPAEDYGLIKGQLDF